MPEHLDTPRKVGLRKAKQVLDRDRAKRGENPVPFGELAELADESKTTVYFPRVPFLEIVTW